MYYYYYHLEKVPYYNTFQQRLQKVLNGRRIYPWTGALGASRGSAETMKKGQIPGPEILSAIHHRENVNLSWLVTGEGPAFRTLHCDSDQMFCASIETATGTRPQDAIYFCHDFQKRIIFISSCKDTFSYKGSDTEFLRWTVLTGPMKTLTSKKLQEIFSYHKHHATERPSIWHDVQLSNETATEILNGDMSPIHLFGDSELSLEPHVSAMPMATLHPLITATTNHDTKAEKATEIDTSILLDTIAVVDQLCIKNRKNLTSEQKARMFNSVYKHSVRENILPAKIPEGVLHSLLEMLIEKAH